MKQSELFKQTIIGVLLFLGVCWSLASVDQQKASESYPNAELLASAEWLGAHLKDESVVIVDVREDKYFDGDVIPGAIRMPWRSFRHNNMAREVGSVFVGVERAQDLLGDFGIMPSDTVVLYDSVARDGGATASYVFWVLDVLGHENKKVLHGGIDAWHAAGGETSTNVVELSPVLYQADPAQSHLRRWASGSFVYDRLGDPYYQILDVRSHDEYLGNKGNKDLHGEPLKLGHIPTAVNLPYDSVWQDSEKKHIKPYRELLEVYKGLNPNAATIVYCHSGRRASFGYFMLRLMGFTDAIAYEGSWNDWGVPGNYYPTELSENVLTSDTLPISGSSASQKNKSVEENTRGGTDQADNSDTGYVSCGG